MNLNSYAESRLLPRGFACLAMILLLIACQPESSDDRRAASGPLDAQLHEILHEKDELERFERLAAFLQETPPEAVDQVTAAFDRSFLDRGDTELVLLMEWWIRFDPEAAVAWAKDDWRADHPRLQYAIVRRVARRDPRLALELYQSSVSRNPQFYSAYLHGAITGWYESGQPGLVDYIMSQPSLELQQQAFGTLARLAVLEKGPEAAAEWAETLGAEINPEAQRYLYQRIASSTAEIEPEQAAAWVERLIEEGRSDTLLRRVAGRWSKKDPEAAMQWLSKFDRTMHQKNAVSETFSGWLRRDPVQAEKWLRAQPEDSIGVSLAPATAALVVAKARDTQPGPGKSKGDEDEAGEPDWLDLLGLAMQIEEEPDRWAAVGKVARFWVKHDAAAADAWMEANSVPMLYRDKVHGRPPGSRQPG